METVSDQLVPPSVRLTVAAQSVDAICGFDHTRCSRMRDRLDAKVWQRSDMRQALASHDMVTVYRLLQRFGMSQRAIAARTGQSQSEISEILSKRRRVLSYELLARIAGGLGLPRGWLCLAYDNETATFVENLAGARANGRN